MSIQSVQIGDKLVGPGQSCFLVAEIGINHNGDVALAKKLIDIAVKYKYDAVKFQKRTINVVYSPEELLRDRESPFGTTNGDLKHGLEFGFDEYSEIGAYCEQKGILWFWSAWDEGSVDFCEQFNPPCYKIASASLTDHNLLQHHKKTGRPIILSTGMSTMDEIEAAVQALGRDNLILMHCTSTYPSVSEEINLAVIETLRQEFEIPVGYSGHEAGLMPTVMSVVGYDACMVERHITLDRSMWGSDQAASIERRGIELLADYIRLWPVVKGDGEKRVYDSEKPIIEKLRRV